MLLSYTAAAAAAAAASEGREAAQQQQCSFAHSLRPQEASERCSHTASERGMQCRSGRLRESAAAAAARACDPRLSPATGEAEAHPLASRDEASGPCLRSVGRVERMPDPSLPSQQRGSQPPEERTETQQVCCDRRSLFPSSRAPLALLSRSDLSSELRLHALSAAHSITLRHSLNCLPLPLPLLSSCCCLSLSSLSLSHSLASSLACLALHPLSLSFALCSRCCRRRSSDWR